MLLHESRREARMNVDGDIVLLDEQDRTLWNQDFTAEGSRLFEQALRSRRFGVCSISAVHAEATVANETDSA